MSTAQDLVAAAKAGVKCLNAGDAAARVQEPGVLLLDLREPDEHEAGAVAGAVHIPRGVLEFKIGEVCDDRRREILLHCGGGGRASLAAQSLQSMGYENVRIVDAPFAEFAAACENY